MLVAAPRHRDGCGWLRSFRCSTPPARAPGCPRREACVVLFGVDAAAISLVFDGTNVGTLGASGVSARVYDELQFTLGEGPCLDSVAHRAPVVVVDLADPDVVRWPAYGRRCWRIRFAACTRCRWWWPASMWAPWTCLGHPGVLGCREAGQCVGGGRAGPD